MSFALLVKSLLGQAGKCSHPRKREAWVSDPEVNKGVKRKVVHCPDCGKFMYGKKTIQKMIDNSMTLMKATSVTEKKDVSGEQRAPKGTEGAGRWTSGSTTTTSRTRVPRASFAKEVTNAMPISSMRGLSAELVRLRALRTKAVNDAERELCDKRMAAGEKAMVRFFSPPVITKHGASRLEALDLMIPPAGNKEAVFKKLCKDKGLCFGGYRSRMTANEKEKSLIRAYQALSGLDLAIKVSGNELKMNGKPIPLSIVVGNVDDVVGARANYSVTFCPILGFVSNKITLHNSERTALFHEYGHYLDRAMGKSISEPATQSVPEIMQLVDDLKKTASHRAFMRVHKTNDKSSTRYLRSPMEVFARFFDAFIEHKLKQKGYDAKNISGGTIADRPDYTARDFAKFGPVLEAFLGSRNLLK